MITRVVKSEGVSAETKVDPDADATSDPTADDGAREAGKGAVQKEIGGRSGPDPTRYGDWEKGGRCIDF